jgi:hypothetical protein
MEGDRLVRKLFVTNVPIHAYFQGWVEVPDDTPTEDLQEAIAKSIASGGWEPHLQPMECVTWDLDEEAIFNWEFSIKETP